MQSQRLEEPGNNNSNNIIHTQKAKFDNLKEYKQTEQGFYNTHSWHTAYVVLVIVNIANL